MNRRDFLSTLVGTGVVLSAPSLLNALPADHRYLKGIGLQLWTVRNQLAANPADALRAVKAAGYRQVELMRTIGEEENIKIARDLGLDVTSAFIDWRSVVTPEADGVPAVDQIVDTAKDIGLKYLVFGYIGKGHRETADQFHKIVERANRAGEKCRKAGVQLCYHNHSFEFAPLKGADKNGFEICIEEFDKDLVKFEIDVFWVDVGGWDAIRTIRRLKGRVAQIHLKDKLKGTPVIYDEGRVPNEAFQELGDGTIDMAAVIRASEEAGAGQCHVEQDQSPDPIASIGQSMRRLKAI